MGGALTGRSGVSDKSDTWCFRPTWQFRSALLIGRCGIHTVTRSTPPATRAWAPAVAAHRRRKLQLGCIEPLDQRVRSTDILSTPCRTPPGGAVTRPRRQALAAGCMRWGRAPAKKTPSCSLHMRVRTPRAAPAVPRAPPLPIPTTPTPPCPRSSPHRCSSARPLCQSRAGAAPGAYIRPLFSSTW